MEFIDLRQGLQGKKTLQECIRCTHSHDSLSAFPTGPTGFYSGNCALEKGSFQHFLNSVKHSVQVHTDAQGPEMSQRWGLEASLVALLVKNPLAMQETRVRSLGLEDLLEKEMETHSSILAWKIPWMEEPLGYSPWGRKELDTTE